MTNKEKLEQIKEKRKEIGGNYNNSILIIIAEELIKNNENSGLIVTALENIDTTLKLN